MFVSRVLRGMYGPYTEDLIEGELAWRHEKIMNHISPNTSRGANTCETQAKVRG
jgi:hypothetical protein